MKFKQPTELMYGILVGIKLNYYGMEKKIIQEKKIFEEEIQKRRQTSPKKLQRKQRRNKAVIWKKSTFPWYSSTMNY